MPKMTLIAVVDDDVAMRDALGDCLLSAGLSYSLFASATDFLSDYAPGRYSAVITDLRMPGMDGLQLLERLQNLGSAPPVVVVTSSAQAQTRASALAKGAAAYLIKPVACDVLINIVQTLHRPAEQ